MGVPEHKARILEICATFAGVQSTVRGSFRGLTSDDMPAFTVLTGQAQHTRDSGDTGKHVRQYRVILLAYPIDAGFEFEGEEIVEPFYAIMEQEFLERPGLYLTDQTDALDGVLDAYLINDGGFQVTDFVSFGIAGAEFVIEVTYLDNIQQGW